MDPQRRFLLTWAALLLAILVLVAGFNAVVNPYDLFDLPRIAGINVLKPAIKNHAALTKTYQVERVRSAHRRARHVPRLSRDR